MATKHKFTTIDAARRLLDSMEDAINNLIEEIKVPVDQGITGAARKAELSSIKQSVIDCRELIQERQKLEDMIQSLSESRGMGDDEADFKAGFAERKAKT